MRKNESWPLLLLLLCAVRASQRGLRTLGVGRSLAQLRILSSKSGFPDPNLAAAIAMAESGGNDKAVGDFGSSFGLWQIHTPAHPQYRPVDLFDADYNARAAFEISKGGTDWSPWTTYKNGDYRRYLGGDS